MYQTRTDLIKLLRGIQSVLYKHNCEYKNMNSDLCSFCYYLTEIDYAIFSLTKGGRGELLA